QVSFPSIQESAPRIRQRFGGSSPRLTNWRDFLIRDLNTSIDTNGFIKIASPVVKIYADGSFDVNHESEGITVTRLAVGEYLISGCLGMNSDAAWGGTDGGFDIPLDINKQPRIWLDYEVNTDGSILVKTYHRTHPQSPEFARNEIDNLTNGDPIDIPSDSFVSARVEMPADSVWNQKQDAAHIVMVEARMKEERTDGNNV
ncbi:phage tail protein, partial [Salmonella enterica subsp. enterica serovar Havana]|nr:phage tail protein [Salmonella enterica subsp. enterica serovar Havana]EFP3084703.1 phage tail protein [Salmonella enterica subsp. enterica serovar Havana]